MIKRFMSCLLVLAMVCTMLPVNALATIADPDLDIPHIETESVTIINPLYADVIDESEIKRSSDRDYSVSDVSESDYITDFDAAVEVLRAGLVARQPEIVVYYIMDEYDSVIFNQLFDTARLHTGNPKEGDSLAWGWGAMNYDLRSYSYDEVWKLALVFTPTYYTTAEQEAELDTAVNALMETVDPNASDYEKIKTVYDYICSNIVYDYANLNDDSYKLKYTPYAALIDGTAVCQGYALLLYRLALEMGIDARVIAGSSEGDGVQDHGWNIVELNGKYYNADSTWDAGKTTYSWFLQSEANFTRDYTGHIRSADYDTAGFHAAYPMGETDFDPNAVPEETEPEVTEPETTEPTEPEETEPTEPESNILAEGTCGDNITWTLDNNGHMLITGEGAMYDYNHYGEQGSEGEQTPWNAYNSQIITAEISGNVTHLGRSAFNGCGSLTSVVLNDGMQTIGDNAFLACQQLSSINLPVGITSIGDAAFQWNVALTELNLPGTLKSIGACAFWSCSGITEIALPEGLETIGEYAFTAVPLTSLTIPSTVTYLGNGICYTDTEATVTEVIFLGDAPVMEESALAGVVGNACYPADNETWTEDVMQQYGGTITWVAYDDDVVARGVCGENLTWILTEDGTLTIAGSGAMYAFESAGSPWYSYNRNILHVVIQEGVTSIGNYAFGWSDMTDVQIPQSVTSIGYAAFYACDDLTSVEIPASVTQISNDVFSSCGSLTGIHVDEENPSYCSDSRGVLLNKEQTRLIKAPGAISGHYTIPDTVTEIYYDAFTLCTQLTGVDIPGSVTSIQNWAFQSCILIKELVIPDSVDYIGCYAFSYCYALEHVTLPDGLETIVYDSFAGCKALKSIEIPASVTYIGEGAFEGCTALSHVTFLSDATEIAADAFTEVTAQAVVPDTWPSEKMQSYGGNLTWIIRGEVTELTVTALPQRLVYAVNDTVDFTGLVVSVSYDNGYTEILPETEYTVSEVDMTTPGRKTVTVTFAGFSATFEIGVHEVTRMELDSAEFPESSHDYANNCDDTQTVSIPGADVIYLEFSAQTETETSFDVIYLYDGEGNQVGSYSGTVLAGQTVAVSGDTVSIRLTSDGSVTRYGYSFTRIYGDVPIHVGTETVPGVDPTCTESGLGNGIICEVCGKESFEVIPPLGHDCESVVTPPTETEKGYTTHTCRRCGYSYVDSYTIPGTIANGNLGENLYWNVGSNGVLTIFGEGDMIDFIDGVEIPWVTYRDQFTSVVIEEGVTSVGACAFGFHPITSVSLPETLTHIGDAAFAYAQYLTEVDLPESLVSIGQEAFALSGLTEVTIPASVQEIGVKAFACPNLTAIHVDETSANYYSWNGLLYSGDELVQVPGGYEGELELHSYTHIIGDFALLFCGKLTKLTIPASIREIHQEAFSNCTALTEICFQGDVPVTIVGVPFEDMAVAVSYPDANTTWTEDMKQAFGGTVTWTTYGENLVAQGYCGENQLYNENNEVVNINTNVVAGKNATWTLTGDGTMTISGEGRMVDCIIFAGTNPWLCIANDTARMTRIVVEEGITYVGEFSFTAFAECVTEVVLPSTLETTGNLAFAMMSGLTTVQMPEGITSIGNDAFFNCTSLTEVDLPESLVSIGLEAFAMTGLTEVTIPANVQEIGDRAFVCQNLTAINVDENNANYYSWNGLLYSQNKLVQVPGGYEGELELHSYTHIIGPSALMYCGKLTKLTIPASITEIQQQPFVNCTALTEICFQGDAPATLAETVLKNLTVTVSYPDANTTWTEEMKQAFGGTVTWTTYGENLVAQGYCGENHIVQDETISMRFEDGIAGTNATWTLTSDGTLQIFGTGRTMDCDFRANQPWIAIGTNDSSRITRVVVDEGITYMGMWLFVLGCENVTEVVLPTTLQEIGMFAFAMMPGLTTVQMPEGITNIGDSAFSNCTSLTEVDLPESLVSIGKGAFEMTGLTEVTIPANVQEIGDLAFVCQNLTAINVDENNANYYSWNGLLYSQNKLVQVPGGYEGELELHSYTHIIGPYALMYCGKLTKLTVPANIMEIQQQPFANCTALTEICFQGDAPATLAETVLDGMTVTVSYPNANTTWTEEVKQAFGGTVTWTPYGENLVAQGYCGENQLYNENNEVVNINTNVVAGKNATWTLTADGTMTISGEGRMVDCVYFAGSNPWMSICFNDATRLTRIVVEEGITNIGDFAFPDMVGKYVTEVILPSTVQKIGLCAFTAMTSLESIHLPEGVTELGINAFGSCTALTSIEIPASLAVIRSGAFSGCTALTEVRFLNDAPVIEADAFTDVAATAYYPAGNETWTEDVMQNYGGTITWEPYGEVEEPIVITAQPVNYVGLVGDMATFSVTAEGEGLTYQWYYFDNEAADWKKASGGTSDTLSVEFKSYRVDQEYRCEITDADGNTVTTDIVRLVAQVVDLIIVTQPVDYVGSVNDELSFSVEATGNGLTYQWYYSDDAGATWKESGTPGFDTATLRPILRAYRDGYQYYCRITDIFGNTVASNVVTATVKTSDVTISEQPVSVTNGILDQLHTFRVTASGENLEYRWEYSDDGGETWQDSWNQGYNTDTLTVRLYAYRSGYLYRCKITSGLKTVVYTDAVELKLQAPSAAIVTQPTSAAVVSGKTIAFKVEATGTDLTYQWYRSNDNGVNWTKTYLGGYNTDTLSFAANASRAALFKCQITDGSGKIIWSEPVKLTILSAELQILTQPESVTCANGATATFTVEAQGDGLKYQWYASADGGETWTLSYLTGYNTANFSFVVNATRASKLYKCVITDAAGNTVETDVVSVTIG